MYLTEYVKKGDRIKLMHTNDPHTKLERGSIGTITGVDHKHATIHVKWDSGSTLSLLLDEGDDFDLVAQGSE